MATPEQFVLRFAELEGSDGGPRRNITFADFQVQPLGYAALEGVRAQDKLTIPIRLRGASVVMSDIPDLDMSERYDAAGTLESHYTSRAIGLVRGGWLPSVFAVTDPRTFILVDRNVVTQIVGRFSGSAKISTEPDFLDLFADLPVRINPLLFVMEGNSGEAPDRPLAADQLREVVDKLRTALPKAELLVGPDSLTGAMGLMADGAAAWARKEAFLLRLAPRLSAPVSAAKRSARWDDVIQTARDCGVPLTSLVVLAALSAAAVPNGLSPARRLLKFKPGYGARDAYNALADLRGLELFLGFMAMYPDHPIQLCTADRDLALFWVGAGASNARRLDVGFAFDLSPVAQILPGDRLDRWAQLVAGG